MPAKAVEVVHHDAAHERLQRLVDVAEVHSLLEHLIAVHLGRNLGDAGDEGRDDGRDFWTLRAASMNFWTLSARKATSLPARSSRTNVTRRPRCRRRGSPAEEKEGLSRQVTQPVAG